MKYENGYYWIKFKRVKEPIIAEFCDKQWHLCGDDTPIYPEGTDYGTWPQVPFEVLEGPIRRIKK